MAFQYLGNPYKEQKSLSDYIAVNEARDLARAQAEKSMALSDATIQAAEEKSMKAKVGQLASMWSPETDEQVRAEFRKLGMPIDVPPFTPENRDRLLTASGYSAGASTPASVQEWNFYDKLQQQDPKKAEQFMNLKRAPLQIDTGGQKIIRTPAGSTGERYEVTPRPQDMPDFKGDQAAATAAGTARGAAEGALEKKILQAPQVEQLLQQAEKLLPKATSGGAATMVRDVAGFFNHPTEGAEYDSQLDVVGAALTAGVPRMEGPQSNYDVALYQKAAGDLANSETPAPVRIAAIKTIRELNNKYANMAPQQKPQANTTGQTTQKTIVKTQTSPSTGKKRIIYSDGSEEIIDAKQ